LAIEKCSRKYDHAFRPIGANQRLPLELSPCITKTAWPIALREQIACDLPSQVIRHHALGGDDQTGEYRCSLTAQQIQPKR
jgi:hypothetical protein